MQTPDTTSRPDREAFLARVLAALERSATQRPPAPPPAVDESVARLAGPGDDLSALFADRAQKVGMQVFSVEADALPDTLCRVLRDHGVERLVLGLKPQNDAAAIEQRLRNDGFELIDWRKPDGLDPQFDIDAGVTDVHAALAETGTLVCTTDADHGRGLSLVPPLHVAMVRESDILPDMIDWWKRVGDASNAALPSNINFITGPSKTADIEGELVTGVHGPEAVLVLLVKDRA